MTKDASPRPRVGIFSLTCCEGCQIEILNLEDVILQVAEKIDIVSFRLAKEKDQAENFDIAFLEGSISTEEDLMRAKEVREKSSVLVALGSCACTGGVQAAKNFMKKSDVEKAVYGKSKLDISFAEPAALSEHITVDHEIKGCPIDNREFVSILKQLLLGCTPYIREYAVCVECKIRENACLLDYGKICLGPISYAGCSAVCPSNGLECIGCRGIMKDANIKSFVKMLKNRTHKIKDIKEAFHMIYGRNPKLKEVR